jgi:hypothetical protein
MLYPMFVLVMLTYVIMLITVRARMGSVRSGKVPASYYALMSGHEVPEFIHKTSRHFSNLFEVPLLFYTAGVLYIALGLSDPLPISLAWGFVVARVIHTCIHLGYNNVLHRLIVFGTGNLFVLAMWIAIVSAAD